ncbi:hypothetical protein BLNAU_18168 [Blattamonas nauphoetae]|uniref:SAP domain-containing protein n=1 Tax=Blattamonas nauphoetae TaxID=2049346 RepID=A0ABQ9X6C3_9EUKA|nr:hypothetical protein BLNAU_18168 [Blattamonas nauphoetae]
MPPKRDSSTTKKTAAKAAPPALRPKSERIAKLSKDKDELQIVSPDVTPKMQRKKASSAKKTSASKAGKAKATAKAKAAKTSKAKATKTTTATTPTASKDVRKQAAVAKKVKELSDLSLPELKAHCERNDLTKSGTKAELLERVADAMLYGPPDRCPKCYGGRLYWDKSRKIYYCKGFYDEDHPVKCSYTADTIARREWKD